MHRASRHSAPDAGSATPAGPSTDSVARPWSPEAELGDLVESTLPELLAAEAEASLPTEPGDRTPSGHRRGMVLGARIAVSVGMLGVLYWQMPDFDWSALLPRWSSRTAGLLSAALALTLLALVLSAVRWYQVLRALGLRSRLRRLVPLSFAGQFVSNVLPTTVGGDVLRVSRLSKENGDPAGTFASVVLERLTGWLVLPLITLFGLAVNPGLRDLGRATVLAVVTAGATLVALAVVLLLADSPRVGGRFGTSGGWTRFVAAVHTGVTRMRRRPLSAAAVLAVGIVYQVVLCLAALMAAAALGIGDMGLTPLLAFFPAVLIAQVLPIGIAGLGIREAAFVVFLTPLGVPAEQAVALGLMLYLLNLAVGLAGVPTFAVGGRTTATAPMTATPP
ncbi:lysylphosphatidylglycerol synthase transmembrane domain-containing protein [Rhabdothermincola salaria]|uniref:lysylphosphatidylglycerol synthase transmembrane domain-containing protein n=1 Tax=Rhabdothermincola salaria TaxID=2903142 RepID=UPI001E3A224D|nr:lysylphosphatidylglycerol synthase transmembrane domain-containing protein [Rhabdothermincola salaria]MCD9623791.1 flippase-like domain-containing protein [Rhabdothermincola salaria]